MNLTDKQKAFCDYYLETLNATDAYKRAYRSCKTDSSARTNSSRMLTNANIKKYIDDRLKEIEDGRIAKVDEVMKFLTASLRGEVQEEVVTNTTNDVGLMKPTIVKKQISAKDRIKAAELIGRRYQLFSDKVTVEGNIGVTIIDDIGVEDD